MLKVNNLGFANTLKRALVAQKLGLFALSSARSGCLFLLPIEFDNLFLVFFFLFLVALNSSLIVKFPQSLLFRFISRQFLFTRNLLELFQMFNMAFKPLYLFLIVTSVTLAASATSFCVLLSFSMTQAT